MNANKFEREIGREIKRQKLEMEDERYKNKVFIIYARKKNIFSRF